MDICNKWGQGQIFAFSALDGESLYSKDFVGTLCGDKLGIKFYSKTKRELVMAKTSGKVIDFDAVTGDYISSKEGLKIIYYKSGLIIGRTFDDIIPMVHIDGRAEVLQIGNIEFQDTKDGEISGIAVDKNRFAFAFGNSKEEVMQKCNEGLSASIDDAEKIKRDYYKNIKFENSEYSKLLAKCVSVMRTQLYSPEGEFDMIWSTPDRLPHKYLWLWDSVFHAIGHRHISTDVAQQLINAIFVHQREDGFIPHLAAVSLMSDLTQPPVIGWGALKVYEKSGDKAFLENVFEKNKKFLLWCRDNRRMADEDLYVWKTEGTTTCRCAESGMDNSTRFDNVINVQAIDFSCFMANEFKSMKRMAEILEKTEETHFFEEYFQSLKAAINNKLWDDNEEFYYDYDLDNQRINKVCSVASFLPLLAEVCDSKKAESLVKYLLDEEYFNTEFPIPSIAVCDKTFGDDMWRGPVWINYNYMIIEGLRNYGYTDLADKIKEKTIFYLSKYYNETGTLFEFYDCNANVLPSKLNRKGEFVEPYDFEARMQSIRDYGWSCTLLCDMLNGNL